MAATKTKPKGRPSMLNAERHKTIVDALEAGGYRDTAARLAGIGVSTLYLWLDRGQNERDRRAVDPNAADPKEQPYLDLVEAVESAEAKAEQRSLLLIQRAAAGGTWQAAAWYLERKFPRKYGRFDRAEVSGPEGAAIPINVSTEDLERKVGAILAKRGTE